jgi:hypothetical protein
MSSTSLPTGTRPAPDKARPLAPHSPDHRLYPPSNHAPALHQAAPSRHARDPAPYQRAQTKPQIPDNVEIKLAPLGASRRKPAQIYRPIGHAGYSPAGRPGTTAPLKIEALGSSFTGVWRDQNTPIARPVASAAPSSAQRVRSAAPIVFGARIAPRVWAWVETRIGCATGCSR